MIEPMPMDESLRVEAAAHDSIFHRLRASIGQVLSDIAAYPPPPINPYMPTICAPGVVHPPMDANHTL